MLGLEVDFILRMIRPQVALATGLGTAGLRDGEPVAGMACRAASRGAVRILSADTLVRPILDGELSGGKVGTMALITSGRAFNLGIHSLEPGVPHNIGLHFPCPGMFAFFELFRLPAVAHSALVRRDGGHVLSEGLIGLGAFQTFVTNRAADARPGVFAFRPVIDLVHVHARLEVAFHAFFVFVIEFFYCFERVGRSRHADAGD